ncbi:PKD domain-containing protein [Luteipulveratus flavus]|uniref:PKD domain-containing protein n=1 Tax=Luteipulveratus flavus TaxID=3031728 RepID=A0ABT6CA30_9MICO|nr:PKD domain-containing protein [Luteipulveratus sp. YIM 133296]MDF8265762.1 PKD domain-containing protein [Luteipulveratus sp. YIM 133296]
MRNTLLGAVVGLVAVGGLALASTGTHATGALAAGAGSTVTTSTASPMATPTAAMPTDETSSDAPSSNSVDGKQSSDSSSSSKPAEKSKAELRISASTKVDGLTVTVDERVYGSVRAGDGAPAQTLWTEWHMGDGTQGGTDGGPMTCNPKHSLAHIDEDFDPFTHTYAKPGTYTITLKAAYCGDKGGTAVTTTRKVTVGNGPVDEDPGSRIDPGPNAKGVSARANGYLLEVFPGYCTPVMSEDTGLRTTTVRLTTPDQGRQSYLVVLKAADGKQVKAHIEADGDSRVLVPLSWHAGSLDFSIHVYVESAARAPEVVAVSSSGGSKADRMSRWCAAPKGGSGTTPSATATGPIVVTG